MLEVLAGCETGLGEGRNVAWRKLDSSFYIQLGRYTIEGDSAGPENVSVALEGRGGGHFAVG